MPRRCLIGVGEMDGLALKNDCARIRLYKAGNDIHQCTFPGAIFANYGVDGTSVDGQVDLVIGDYGAESFVEVFYFQYFFHNPLLRRLTWRRESYRAKRYFPETVTLPDFMSLTS